MLSRDKHKVSGLSISQKFDEYFEVQITRLDLDPIAALKIGLFINVLYEHKPNLVTTQVVRPPALIIKSYYTQ